MATPTLILLAATALTATVLFGAALYEVLVVDPRWPQRPGIVQARNGGLSRTRFWFPAPLVLDVLLVVAVAGAWADGPIRAVLLVGLAAHAADRAWWLADLGPKAAAFERSDPADVDEAAARRWTRRAAARLPLMAITACATLAALALA